MSFPSSADSDPDPTTQMPWPRRSNGSGSQILKSGYPGGEVESPQGQRPPLRVNANVANIKTLMNPAQKRRLSTKDLIFLSISMAGAQIAWTVELGYVAT
jgi:solute carrier family 45 protein 1/2/4